MKMDKQKIKFAGMLSAMLLSMHTFAQSTAPASAPSDFDFSINTIMCFIAVVLLGIIIIMAMTVNTAIEVFKKNKANKSSDIVKNVSILLGLLLLSQWGHAQVAVPAAAAVNVAKDSVSHHAHFYFYGFLTVIIVEVAIILFFIKSLRFLTGIEQYRKENAANEKTLWETINQFKPLEDEAGIDTGHNYDGIRELDNITPPWFTISFLATIVFAIVYLYRYEVVHSAPNEIEEYEASVQEAKIVQDSLLKLEGNKVDENTVVMLGATGIEAGKNTFTANCAACHGDKGQGGVGPNLTDNYWLHGGSIHDVFKSIKYGWQDKGMKSWKDDFSPTQIAQLASFVKSLKGSNPPGAKDKQGELYDESKDNQATAAVTDSTKTK